MGSHAPHVCYLFSPVVRCVPRYVCPCVPAGCTRLHDVVYLDQAPGRSASSQTAPNPICVIGMRVFSDCPRLTTVYLPGSVRTISHSAFNRCEGLAFVFVPPRLLQPQPTNIPRRRSSRSSSSRSSSSESQATPAEGDVEINVRAVLESAFENCPRVHGLTPGTIRRTRDIHWHTTM